MSHLSPPPSLIPLIKKNGEEFTNSHEWMTWLSAYYDNYVSVRPDHNSIQNANLGKGTTAPTQRIIGNYTAWEFAIGDDAVMTIELDHTVDPGYDIGIHFTFAINEAYATNSGEVQFQVDYSLIKHDGAGDTLTSPTQSGTLTTGDINIPATAYEPKHVTNMVIPSSQYSRGDVIGLTLSRIAITDGNNPTADPAIVTVHLEYKTSLQDWYEST